MIELVRELLDKVYLQADPDPLSGCGFNNEDLDIPAPELEAE